ncbi:MAG: hypothetical protein AAGF24_03675 [Cyanobacteria bacterium P01_H01_bin.121]
MLERFQQAGLLKARGQQRSDSTHVLVVVRAMTRLEFLGETLRYALNTLAELAPTWLRSIALEDCHTPKTDVTAPTVRHLVHEHGCDRRIHKQSNEGVTRT